MVEAQHVASTMKLVDTAAEQDLLETILEESKPPLPFDVAGLSYLLSSPFRYAPYPPGSRFRSSSDPGIFYASETVRTAAAEIGYWRWKFLQETTGLHRLGPATHTAFSAGLDSTAVDLRCPPFDSDEPVWSHPEDYTATQAFAALARAAAIEAIFYKSVRDPDAAWCVAVLTPSAFASKQHDPATQTWQLIVTEDQAIWRRESGVSFSFGAAAWSSRANE